MKVVHQRHNNGCAIACLSMLTGIGYNTLFRAVHGKYKNPSESEYPGLSFEKIIRILLELNLNYRISFNKRDIKRLKNNSLIVIDYGETSDGIFYEHSRHAIVWDANNKSVIDPYPFTKRKIEVTEKFLFKNFSFLIEI